MKVWIALAAYDREPSFTIGVYQHEAEAREAADSVRKEHIGIITECREIELGKTYGYGEIQL